MARGGHGLPKVSCGPAMPKPYTPCGRATPQTALWPFGGWPTRRAGGLRPSSSPLDTPSHTGPVSHHHGRTARGGHGLPKVSPRHAMPHLSMPCGRATPAMTLQLFQEWSVRRADGLQPSSTPLDTPHHKPMLTSHNCKSLRTKMWSFFTKTLQTSNFSDLSL
jgi:hypothetical protein